MTPEQPTESATEYDPLTHRERVIRAIHNFANYLTAHPEMPVPGHIDAYRFVHPSDVESGDERAELVRRWAVAQGIPTVEGATSEWATLPVVKNADVWINFTYGAIRTVAPAGEGNA